MATADTVWDRALEVFCDRLREMIPDVKVEADRRSEPSDDEFPLLIVVDEGDDPDHEQSPGETFYPCTYAVTGYVRADAPEEEAGVSPDTQARRNLNQLRARVLAALNGYQPPDCCFTDAIEQSCSRQLYDAEDSALAAGEFTSRFEVLVTAPTGHPWAE